MSLTRESLYEQVWAKPMLTVAKDFGVSGNYLARVCVALNVPWPPRGYWAKVAAGRAPIRQDLSPARAGDQLTWSRGQTLGLPIRRVRKAPTTMTGTPAATPETPRRHPLVDGVRQFFLIDRKTDAGYLRPRKHLLVDVVVSESMIDVALDVANELFLMLERHGHRVTLAPGHQYWHRPPLELEGMKHDNFNFREPWRPERPTVVFVKDVVFGMTLYETSEAVEVQCVNSEFVPVSQLTPAHHRWMQRNYTWSTTRHHPTGRLALRAYAASGVKWQQEWREGKPGELPHKFRTIRRTLLQTVTVIEEALEKARLEAEERHRQWEIAEAKRNLEERERREREAYKDSREQLLAIVERWALARRIEDFFLDAERRAATLQEEERAQLSDRLSVAREMLGSLDTLRHFGAWRSVSERLASPASRP